MGMSCRIGEGIRKRLPDLFFNSFFTEQGNGGIHLVSEDAEIIEAKNMVSMRVREDCGLDQLCILADELQTQFRAGIDDEFAKRSAK